MMKEERTAEKNKLIRKMTGIFGRIFYRQYRGEYDKALKFIEQEEKLLKHFQGDIPEEIKILHTGWLYFKALIYAHRGDLARSLNDANELIRVAKSYDDKRSISGGIYLLGLYYWFTGDLDISLGHLDGAIRIREENIKDLNDFIWLANQLYLAIRVSIDKEDLKGAKEYFKRLEEIKELIPRDLMINDLYRLIKACILKSSMRFRDQGMAEDLFREIIEEEGYQFVYKLRALIEFCELLLVELKVTSDITIIGEIKPLLEKLIGMTRKSGLYFWLIEAYILQGKIALVMFDMESAQRYLTQAQHMAEKYGYIGLADEISNLHEAMMEKKDTWEKMKKINAPFSDRMELARLDDHLKGKFHRLMMKMERAAESPPKKDVF